MTNALATNPYAPPQTDEVAPQPETDHDRFIIGEVSPMLEAKEQIRYTAFLIKAPALWKQFLFGGLILLLFYRYYLAAVTNRRIILMRTKHWWMRPKLLNLETDEIRWDDVEGVKVGGFANNRSLTLRFLDGTSRTLRIGPWAKFVSGQKAFFELMQNFDKRRLGA